MALYFWVDHMATAIDKLLTEVGHKTGRKISIYSPSGISLELIMKDNSLHYYLDGPNDGNVDLPGFEVPSRRLTSYTFFDDNYLDHRVCRTSFSYFDDGFTIQNLCGLEINEDSTTAEILGCMLQELNRDEALVIQSCGKHEYVTNPDSEDADEEESEQIAA